MNLFRKSKTETKLVILTHYDGKKKIVTATKTPSGKWVANWFDLEDSFLILNDDGTIDGTLTKFWTDY